MTQQEFDILSKHLQSIVEDVPLKWGKIQNDGYDNRFKKEGRDIFAINNYDQLLESVKDYPKELRDYYCHRWFLLQCSRCEEFLFYKNENVIPNPQTKSKSWDIRIDRRYQIKGKSFSSTHYFDVKGARIPSNFIANNLARGQNRDSFAKETIKDPRGLICHLYENQSDGVRFDMQNRLFLVHHSFVEYKREMNLRTVWVTKMAAAKTFVEKINDIVLYSYKGCTTGLIFILENQKDSYEYIIPGLNPNCYF